jgi:nitrogenase molybdenum-iron protein alpha/beta subunit
MLDHLGNNHRCTVGYRGTLEMLFDIGNIFLKPTRSGCMSWFINGGMD